MYKQKKKKKNYVLLSILPTSFSHFINEIIKMLVKTNRLSDLVSLLQQELKPNDS